VRQPKLYPALKDYTFTDERLKFVHILECMNYLRIAGADGVIPAVYFEFGCHSGRTFSSAVRAGTFLNLRDAQYYAFDSFEGLPPTDAHEDGYFQTGTFATSRSAFLQIVERNTGLRLDSDHVVQGFYSASLTKSLQARMPKVGVVHIDVDLYSSTVEVLKFIKPLMVVGTVLVFDDWYTFPPGANKGERRALQEFCAVHPSFAVEEWKNYSTFGKSFFVTSLPTLSPQQL
jgi:hypothetical protein